MRIRRAAASEASALTELALRSKAHWGYLAELVRAFRAELTVAPEAIEAGRIYVAEDSGGIAGLYGLAPLADGVVELAFLFVEPARLRSGIGRALLVHAATAAHALGASCLQIQGDPHATAFYLATGARQTGELESDSIPGRMLPLFQLALPMSP